MISVANGPTDLTRVTIPFANDSIVYCSSQIVCPVQSIIEAPVADVLAFFSVTLQNVVIGGMHVIKWVDIFE